MFLPLARREQFPFAVLRPLGAISPDRAIRRAAGGFTENEDPERGVRALAGQIVATASAVEQRRHFARCVGHA
jgi:hypothetical protein